MNEAQIRPWKILLVEDDEDDFILARAWLSISKGSQFILQWAQTYERALELLADPNSADAVLIDYDLGVHNGVDFVREMKRIGCGIPAILLTGRGSYDVDMEAMKAGADDYIAKNEVTPQLLERTIRYSIERKQIEEALRSSNEELERRVAARTSELHEMRHRQMERVEAERLELAQEIHDGPMQELYAMVFQLQALADGVNDSSDRDIVESMLGTLEKVIGELRLTAYNLRPPALAPFGLQKAIQSHVEQFRMAHPTLDLHLSLQSDRQTFSEDVRLALFRNYQMAMSNIVRHADASKVSVRFHFDEESAVLEIQDNGKGFDSGKPWIELAREGHLGLVGASERAEAIGGWLEIQSALGQGTLVRTVLPRTNKKK